MCSQFLSLSLRPCKVFLDWEIFHFWARRGSWETDPDALAPRPLGSVGCPAAEEAAPEQRRGPRPTAAARPVRRRSGGRRAWQEFRRATLLAREVGAASVRMHGRSITMTFPTAATPAPTSTPVQQPPASGDVPSADKAPRHRPPSWHQRQASRRARFYEAKDFSAVDAALPKMFEEATTIAPMMIDAAQATTSGIAHAMGPAASAASASAPVPALAGSPGHAAPWSRPLSKGAEPSLGAPHACPSSSLPPSQPPLANKEIC